MPPKNDSGTEMTSAHGQETTRKTSARRTHSSQGWPKNSGAMTASSTAAATTQGVYQRAKRVIKSSCRVFFSEAFSTRSRIFATVLSPKTLLTSTLIMPVRFTVPLATASPGFLSCGSDSPVRAEASTAVSPSKMSPSSGIFS